MNGSVAGITDYVSALQENTQSAADSVTVIIAPPMPLLGSMAAAMSGSSLKLAAQNVAMWDKGAYTGESSAAMLSELGCGFCLVGHSERRALFAEDDAQVLAKVRRLLAADIKPVLCVGETLEQRESGQAEEIVHAQVLAVLSELTVQEREQLVLAYEPVWAIGTGKTATPEQAQAMHASIRRAIAGLDESLAQQMTILYGGSVNAANAQALFAQEDIDGGLVGGASLKADEFSQICEAIG